MKRLFLILLVALSCTSTTAFAAFPVDIGGAEAWGSLGVPANTTINVDLAALLGNDPGTDVVLKGVSWDVILSTFNSSWASGQAIAITDAGTAAPIATLFMSGATTMVTSSVITGATAIGPVTVIGGSLDLEFFDSTFGAGSTSINARYQLGSTLKFDINKVPEPTCLGLILSGLSILCLRRRK